MNRVKSFVYCKVIPFVGKLLVHRNIFINVIYYHDIVSGEGNSFMQTNLDVFRKQMEFIAENGFKTYRFDELDDETKRFERKRIIITFDDGWLSNYSEVFDLMASLGLKFNVFLTVGEIGNNPNYLSWELAREMYNSGLVGFGVHTYSHPFVGDMSTIDPQQEFFKANQIFCREMGYEPLDFCYPYGSCSKESHSFLITNTNYHRIYTSYMMYSYCKNEKIVFGRNGISNEESFDVFKSKLMGYYNVYNSLVPVR